MDLDLQNQKNSASGGFWENYEKRPPCYKCTSNKGDVFRNFTKIRRKNRRFAAKANPNSIILRLFEAPLGAQEKIYAFYNPLASFSFI